jgi:tetratricopeptide (TPR) repeat protein
LTVLRLAVYSVTLLAFFLSRTCANHEQSQRTTSETYMNKKKLLYGGLGLVLGLAIGFWGTDSLNRNTAGAADAASNALLNDGELPPDHPPAGAAAGATGQPGAGGPQNDVMAVIEQARAEPGNFDAQFKAGTLFAQINRFDQALEFYQRAYQIKQNDVGVLVALGNMNFDLKRYAEAERWYQDALKFNPGDVNVRTDLGLSYFLREPKELDKAIAEYRASLGYDPRHEQTLQNLITALLAKGDKAAARPHLQQLEQVNPNNQALAQLRAQLN